MKKLATVLAAAAALLVTTAMPGRAAQAVPGQTSVVLLATPTAAQVGRAATVTGHVTGGARPLVLETRTATGWRTAATATSTGGGGFSLPLPTAYDGAHGYRVRAPAVPGWGEGTSSTASITVRPAYRPIGSARQWSREDPSFPFRWDPCAPIPYRVNLGGTPHRNLRLVKRALEQVARATGFTFEYAGRTHGVPFARGRSAARQIPGQGLVIAWTTPRRVPALAGDVVGIGGPGPSYHRDQTGWQITSAGVAIDKAGAAHLRRGMVDGPSVMSLLLHELGHAMGLGHVSSKHEIMHEGLGPWSRPHYGAGDLAGLAQLGADQGCF